MMFTKLALAAVAMMAGVMATPTPAEVAEGGPAPSVLAALTANETLVARGDGLDTRQAGAGIHLVNAPYLTSYCRNDDNCNSFPSGSNTCSTNSVRKWEGSSSCTFSTGVIYSWTIFWDSHSKPNYSKVGTGYNGNNWVIRKDDQHVMFYDGNGNACRSIYYSLPA
ncbi:hypothetical protein V8F06_009884 [Rhypophila decipiens]